MLATAARTLLENLDAYTEHGRKVEDCYHWIDSALHLFSIAVSTSELLRSSHPNALTQPGSTEFTMLAVSDVDDVFLPKPPDLLVTLNEARAGLEVLLGRMNEMFQGTHQTGSALEPAEQAAFKLIVSSLPRYVCVAIDKRLLLRHRVEEKLLFCLLHCPILEKAL